jgi:hypothetical protein
VGPLVHPVERGEAVAIVGAASALLIANVFGYARIHEALT